VTKSTKKEKFGRGERGYRWGRPASCVVLIGMMIAPAARGQGASPGKYMPARVAPRDHAVYLLHDGAIQIVASSKMDRVVRALNALFVTSHPEVKFAVLDGDNYSAMAALTFDRSAFAPLGSQYTRIGLGDNLKIAGEPVGFRIAHATLTPGSGVPALAVIANAANPITSLTMAQLTRIFAVGAPAGDIATWGQAGVAGKLAAREVHPIGPMPSDYTDSDDPQAGEFLSTDKLAGLNMNHRYVAMAQYTDVVARVKEDPAAIGITALNIPLSGVKVVALKSDTGLASTGTAADIAAGHYPLDRFVYIYLRVGKGMPMDPFAKEYIRMVLSDEGQRAIANSAEGYIPLNAGELAEERARLDR
jgi:phosphate transport system substrate-binding protein